MKSLIITFFVFTLAVALNGQQYVTFPTKEAHWNIYLEYGQHGLNPRISILKYYIGGDTIINDISYKKLMREIGDSSLIETFYIGALREEEMKIYYQGLDYLNNEHVSNSEILLYDFTKKVNDTIIHIAENPHFKSIITDIDSVLIGPGYRKRYEVNSSTNYLHQTEYWIEGIGSITNGLLGHITDIPTCCHSFWEHVCYKDQFVELVNPNFNSCHSISRTTNIINPNKNDSQIKVYPNPVENIIHIEVLESSKNYSVKIYSISGYLIYSDVHTNNQIDLELGLSAGYYILEVSNDKGKTIGINRIIK